MTEFYTILTATGRAQLATATASGTPISLTKMAVGNGDNEAYYKPDESQTALKGETWRGDINNLYIDPTNANWIVAELVIPDTVGGFTIREVGLFDKAGALFAVGKYPASYKPTLDAGANKQLYVRMIMEVSNAAAVTLLVDPSVVLATRQYVDSKVASEINKLDGKQSVRVATTAAITLSGLQTIDGIALVAGDRVLVKDQVAGKDNGIYVVADGAWTRAADADASIEVTPGLFVPVEQGAANADSLWQLVTDAPMNLGTTVLVFEMADGKSGIAAGTYRSVTVNARGYVTGGTNPTTLAEYGLTDAAPINSPNFTGAPTAPTPAANDNSKKMANTEFVGRAIGAIPTVDLSGKQDKLGFTPVQQGTGIGQLNNTVKIGWDGSGLKATVDITDQGNFVFQPALDSALANKVTGAGIHLNWKDTAGQPTWLFGGDAADKVNVYNPANFKVAYANLADSASKVAGVPMRYAENNNIQPYYFYGVEAGKTEMTLFTRTQMAVGSCVAAMFANQLSGQGLVHGGVGGYTLNKRKDGTGLPGGWEQRGQVYDYGSGAVEGNASSSVLWQRTS